MSDKSSASYGLRRLGVLALSPQVERISMTDNTNDNETYPATARAPEPDAHGQAAMLLVESLVHGLVARSVISVEDAVEIVEIATEVKADVAADLGESADTMRRSLDMLAAIGASIRLDAKAG